jgi:hypothetical protein
MRTLAQAGADLIASGATTPREVDRVLSGVEVPA